MPRALVHVVLHGGLQGHVGGEVVVIEEDAHVFSAYERRTRAEVVIEGDLEELRAKYLKRGVPDDVRAAAVAEDARFNKALDEYAKIDPKDFIAKALAKPTLDKKIIDAASPALWPARAVALDLGQLDAASLDVVRANHAAIDATRDEAKTSAKAEVLAALADVYGEPVDAETAAMKTIDILASLAARTEAAFKAGRTRDVTLLDRASDAIRAASKDGRDAVLAEAFADVSIAKPHVLDAAALEAATVTVTP